MGWSFEVHNRNQEALKAVKTVKRRPDVPPRMVEARGLSQLAGASLEANILHSMQGTQNLELNFYINGDVHRFICAHYQLAYAHSTIDKARRTQPQFTRQETVPPLHTATDEPSWHMDPP